MIAATNVSPNAPFEASRARFESLLGILEKTAAVSHYEWETLLQAEGRELLRQLFQDKLDLEAMREPGIEDVVDAKGVPRKSIEPNHKRPLITVFGKVTVRRPAYQKRYYINLYPADAVLNLSIKENSHGLRRLAAIECSSGSFGDAVKAIKRATGVRVGKRQVEELAQWAAADFDSFYASSPRPKTESGDVLVLSVDGKDVVIRQTLCVSPPPRRPSLPSPRSACPEARNTTASAWPRPAPSTPLPRSPAPSP